MSVKHRRNTRGRLSTSHKTTDRHNMHLHIIQSQNSLLSKHISSQQKVGLIALIHTLLEPQTVQKKTLAQITRKQSVVNLVQHFCLTEKSCKGKKQSQVFKRFTVCFLSYTGTTPASSTPSHHTTFLRDFLFLKDFHIKRCILCS